LPSSPEELPGAGSVMKLEDQRYKVVDVKAVAVVAAEGELPEVAPPGSHRKNADLAGTGGVCGTLEFHEDGTELYLGKYADFAALKLRELRPVPGWDGEVKAEKRGAAALNCPKCGAVVELRAAGQTQSAVCGSCGSIIDTANPVWTVLQAATEKLAQFKPLIPIGARGELFGVTWEVIGLQRRGDKSVSWFEYLLFNPWNGFRFLTTWGGHWNFVERVLDVPEVVGSHRQFRGQKFKLFARGDVRVLAVLGEFYWKVERGEHALYWDYVRPPEMLSQENYPELKEEAFSLGHYIAPNEVMNAFKVSGFPWRTGIFANQPNPWDRRLKTILPWFILALIVAICIEGGTAAQETEALWESSYLYQRVAPPAGGTATSTLGVGQTFPSTAAPIEAGGAEPREGATAAPDPNTITTPHFRIKNPGTHPVNVRISAPVSNSWIGFDIDLVNVETKEVYPANLEVSYYFGTDSDGSWSEGGTTSSTDIPEVPAGEYYLEIDPEADPSAVQIPYTVNVQTGGVFASNFILTLLIILAWPAFILYRRHAWEKARWEESDFSP
jgi:hypothetical protein